MGPNLVSGGGTADKVIKFWKDGVDVGKQIDTGSQICGLVASPTTPELISCQGFSLNQIIVWSGEGKRMQTIHGHRSRVIYSALSPDGEFLATGAGDQCLKVWKMFGKKPVREWNMPEIR
jgi:WD40 repeat protein